MASPICPGQSGIKNASWVWSVMLQKDMSLFQGRKIRGLQLPPLQVGRGVRGSSSRHSVAHWGTGMRSRMCLGEMGIECSQVFMLCPHRPRSRPWKALGPKDQGRGQE